MLELRDKDLFARLDNTEDSFVERKSAGDSKDWLKTVVAFANSAPVGYPAVLFIGVRDDGTPEGSANLDKLQKTFSKKIAHAYPPIPTFAKILKRGKKEFLAVIVPGSSERPHFAGRSYVRVGSETREASEGQFTQLIAQRNSKAAEIIRWKGQKITVLFWTRSGTTGVPQEYTVVDCNQFYATLQAGTHTDSISLSKIEISLDDELKCPRLEVKTY